MIDTVPESEKAMRLQVLLDRQREIQRVNYSKQIGEVLEVMVEGANPARGQISGRSSTEHSGEHYTGRVAHRSGAWELPCKCESQGLILTVSLAKPSKGRDQ
jgi:tRNA A37 methylthiotransferase MiaB